MWYRIYLPDDDDDEYMMKRWMHYTYEIYPYNNRRKYIKSISIVYIVACSCSIIYIYKLFSATRAQAQETEGLLFANYF